MPPVLPGEKRKESGTESRSSGWKEGRKEEGGQEEYEGATSRRSPFFISTEPHLVFYSSAHREYAPLSPRCRSRHLLLALFFAATRHLHNYNLASAVSKTRAPGPSPSVSGPVVVVVVVVVKRGGGKKERKERKNSETCFR